jgi:hypothetical protein
MKLRDVDARHVARVARDALATTEYVLETTSPDKHRLFRR